ncbi:Hypothetical protein, putative [Bodo saltans]|uniref:Uncharacterized protein n=1 Tax=Bodo saltans TaxID=75058 RepID=A0A0S4JII4_BODSA|nr:Hypothetical protein, putative [Bodo saltans]|eukprot:CUG89984.1 Hypothetical protein, putative [Bodo saltans]
MSCSPAEAIQRAPPLCFSMDQSGKSRVIVEASNPPHFVVTYGSSWVCDQLCDVAFENEVGRVCACDNVIAVSLCEKYSLWISLPATEGSVLSLALARCGSDCIVVAGTVFGLDVFFLDAGMTIVNRLRFDSGPVHYTKILWNDTVVAIDEDNQIFSWKLSDRNAVPSYNTSMRTVIKGLASKWFLWSPKEKFRHACDDLARRHLIVLSSTTVTVWSPEAGVKGNLQVSTDVVGVLPSHAHEPFLAVLVYENGKRKRVHSTPLTHGAISMSLGEDVPFPVSAPPSFRVKFSASLFHSTLMCSESGTLFLENARFPFSPGSSGPCDIVSIVRLPEPPISVSVVRIESSVWHGAFILHGRRGVLATLHLRTVPHVLGSLLSSTPKPNEEVAALIQAVGVDFISDCLLSAHSLASDPACSQSLNMTKISGAIENILAPAFSGNKILFAPLVSSVRRKYTELSHSVTHQLRHHFFDFQAVIAEIEQAQLNTVSIFSSGGWLDTTSPQHGIEGLWSDLGVELTHTQVVSASQAAAAQALFLGELSQMLSFVKAFCVVMEVGRKSCSRVEAPSNLHQLLWCKRERYSVLLEVGTSLIVSITDPSELSAIDTDGIPDELRILATIRKECAKREVSLILTRTLQAHTKTLHNAGLMHLVCSMLKTLGLPALLQGVALWGPHDPTGSASRTLLDILEEIEDVNVFSSVAHFALSNPSQLTVEWVEKHSFSDSRRDVLVHIFGSCVGKLPHRSLSLRGQVWHALTMVNGSPREKRECRLALLDFAQSKYPIALEDRATAIAIAHSIEGSFSLGTQTSDLLHVCKLQQVLLAGAGSVELDSMLFEQLETQLLTEDSLFRIATQISVRCAPEVQLSLILRHDDIAGYSEAIFSALESEVLWCVRDGSSLVESLVVVANKNLARFPHEIFPMARFLALMFVQHGVLDRQGMLDFCGALESVALLEPLQLFMAVGDVLLTTIGEWESSDVLASLVSFLCVCKFSADERMRCLEIVSSHVALICTESRDDEYEQVEGRHRSFIDALKRLVCHHPSTHLVASQITSALRNTALF